MSDAKKQDLKFSCYKCREKSTYPNYMEKGKDPSQTRTVVKRCQNCGLENTLELPAGFVGGEKAGLLRGFPGKQ